MDAMSVLYDHQAFEMQRFGGISRYFYELMTHLQGEVELSLRFYTNDYLHYGAARFPGIYLPERPYKWLKGPIKKMNEANSLRRLTESSCRIFHPTYHHPYFLDHLGDKAYVLTVHDMNYELMPQYLPQAERVMAMKKATIERADRIIAISENTKKDIVELLHISPDKIDVVYHGVRPLAGQFTKLDLPERYLLYIGDRRAYKNFSQLLEAFGVLAKTDADLCLICTGRPFAKSELKRMAELGVLGRVLHFHVDDEGLQQLYHQAQLFIFPSLYEGFGLPILEAFSYECPVLLSDASCFPEIAGEAAAYFDPHSLDSLVEMIRMLLKQESRRAGLVKAGLARVKEFTWEKCAQHTEAVYQKLL